MSQKNNKKNFISGTDSLLLSSFVLSHAKNANKNWKYIIELGSGDGLSSLLLAKALKEINILGIDIQEQYTQKAQKAAVEENLYQRVIFKTACVSQRKKINKICTEHNFTSIDAVFANPPYYKNGQMSPSKSRQIALHEHEHTLSTFCKSANLLLKHHAYFFCIYPASQTAYLLQALEQNNFGIRTILPIHSRPNKPALWILTAARKQAATDIRLEKSISIYQAAESSALSIEICNFCPWM